MDTDKALEKYEAELSKVERQNTALQAERDALAQRIKELEAENENLERHAKMRGNYLTHVYAQMEDIRAQLTAHTAAERWEYDITIHFEGTDMRACFQQQGEQGWEYVEHFPEQILEWDTKERNFAYTIWKRQRTARQEEAELSTSTYRYKVTFSCKTSAENTMWCEGVNDHDAIEVCRLKTGQQNFGDIVVKSVTRELTD